MIVDGLRRCSDSAENQRARPGRQIITFLIASNLAMYVWDTFELKSYEMQVASTLQLYSMWSNINSDMKMWLNTVVFRKASSCNVKQ